MLLDALCKYGKEASLRNIELFSIHTEGHAVYAEPEYEDIFRINALFVGKNVRGAVDEGRADFTPIFLSEIPNLFRREVINLDVCLVTVTPPDKHGFCSLGTSVDVTRAAVQNAKFLIGQVNPNMPRTFGDSNVHMSHFDKMVECNDPLPEAHGADPDETESRIGQFIADNLVEDGATLQMGIGSIPNAVLAKLHDHRDLGVHTEMFSDGVIPLIKEGVITNAQKVLHTGKLVSGFAYGSRDLYDFMDNNPLIVMMDVGYVNKTSIVCQNPRVTAINSCIEVDLTGQVVSDSIGPRIYSGVGGQIDFIRGAALSDDGLGKPIIAMPAMTKKGASKIVPFIKNGAGVTTTRAHVHYVVTEFGVAYLFGKSIRQRAYELIRIAHPDHREELEKASFERLKVMPSP